MKEGRKVVSSGDVTSGFMAWPPLSNLKASFAGDSGLLCVFAHKRNKGFHLGAGSAQAACAPALQVTKKMASPVACHPAQSLARAAYWVGTITTVPPVVPVRPVAPVLPVAPV